MTGYLYILKSLRNGKYYVGSTNNLQRRLEQHNKGDVKATRYIRPLDMVFYQLFDTEEIARKIEYRIKKFKSREIVERIIAEGKIKIGV